MILDLVPLPEENRLLQAKYNVTAWFYDLLDYPWERLYRRWRPDTPVVAAIQGPIRLSSTSRPMLRPYRSPA